MQPMTRRRKNQVAGERSFVFRDELRWIYHFANSCQEFAQRAAHEVKISHATARSISRSAPYEYVEISLPDEVNFDIHEYPSTFS